MNENIPYFIVNLQCGKLHISTLSTYPPFILYIPSKQVSIFHLYLIILILLSIKNMTETICSYTEAKDLHLINIISLAEDNLQTNFKRILVRLNHHEKFIQNTQQCIKNLTTRIVTLSEDIEKKMNEDSLSTKQRLQSGNIQILKMKQMLNEMIEKVNNNEKSVTDIVKQQDNLRYFIDVDTTARNTQFENMKQKIRNIELEICSVSNNLGKKQNINEVQKVKQSINDLNQQFCKVSEEQKFVQFKLDKFEIINQKTEKNQMNKEINMMKELEEKIKNELKNAITTSQRIPMNPITENICKTQKTIKQICQVSQICSIERPHTLIESTVTEEKKEPNNYYTFPNPSHLQKLLSNMSDTLSLFERKFEQIQNEMKQVSENFDSAQKSKKNNKMELQEKLNSIKPQLIKIWAKCDMFDDKISYYERKMQEKSKQIAHITQVQKQTQFSKFDEKIKLFQTQIYANIKQLKNKVDGKYSISDFEKFSKNILEKIQILNDQIILKSDKLEVKKALLFLQSKIKEIILVISEDQQNEKDALITKKQVKCISCDKEIDKFVGVASNMKGNWDSFPSKEHSPEVLGRFGMTSFGSLARKLKKLDSKDIPVLARKAKESVHVQSKSQFN